MNVGQTHSEEPLYRQLADWLERAIHEGTYPVGSRLPTEKELCQRHRASRHTVRDALKCLAERGMIRRRQGSGTLVVADRPRFKYNQYVSSINDLLQYGPETRFEILRSVRVEADERLAQLLKCRLGQHCFHLHGIRYRRDLAGPVCITEVYRVALDSESEKRLDDLKAAVFVLREELDVRHLGRVEQAIEAVMIDEQQAVELGADVPTAGLRTIRRYFDRDDHLLLAAISLHPGPLFRYATTLHRIEHP